jgi:hypothetical protein
VTPGYKDEEIRDLFDLRRGVERQALIERMPELATPGLWHTAPAFLRHHRQCGRTALAE